MSEAKKVLWKEGLFLQPQHFQHSEKYLLTSVNSRLSTYIPYYFGFTSVTIDRDAIANGTCSITRAYGIMPDGTVFDIPKQDNAPPARPYEEHFTPEQQSLDVYFALPMISSGNPNVTTSSTDRNNIRYKSRIISLPDEVSGELKKDIEVGDFNFRILYGDESRENYSSMQIARLKRASSGQIIIDESYIPPLLHIGASHVLMDQIRSMLELLIAKNTSLSQGRKQLEGGFAEFGGQEQTAFRLLHTINTYTPLLNHHNLVPTIHPYELFTDLSQFAGALCTFSAEITLRNIPKYEHNNLSTVFETFNSIIRKILGADISAGCVNIPIEDTGPASYVCNVEQKLFKSANFYFGVSADITDKELIVGTLSRIKMCSREKLELLIPSAMPGLQLVHVPNPPEELSTKSGFIYFKLERKGAFWAAIEDSGTIAFYFPHHFKNLRMEVLALKS